MKKSRIIVSAIAFSLLGAGIVSAQTKLKIEKKSPSANEAIIEIHKDGKDRVFVVEGSQSEIQSKLDSIFEAHGIERSPNFGQENFSAYQWTGDSTQFNFDFNFDDIDPQVFAFVQRDFPMHMEMFGMNDSLIGHHEMMLRGEMERIQNEMENMQIAMNDSVIFLPKMHRNMVFAPMVYDHVIVIQGEEDDPHQAIILKKDDDFNNGKEIEVKTKKKKNETVITIRKK